MNRLLMLVLVAALSATFASDSAVSRDNRQIQGFRMIMTDDRGLPLEDGIYDITIRVYDKPDGGTLIDEMSASAESKRGVCVICEDYLNKLLSQGHREVWISLKVNEYPLPRFRTRVFLDRTR